LKKGLGYNYEKDFYIVAIAQITIKFHNNEMVYVVHCLPKLSNFKIRFTDFIKMNIEWIIL
jgi:hypothetical protein